MLLFSANTPTHQDERGADISLNNSQVKCKWIIVEINKDYFKDNINQKQNYFKARGYI